MTTRCGDLDPGLLLHLLRTEKMSIDDLEHLLNRESGLRGIAGESDMRKLLDSNEPEARLAVELYCYRAHKYIGAYLAVLGGADAILFGGGVGEHAPEIRECILAGLEWAGIVDGTILCLYEGGEKHRLRAGVFGSSKGQESLLDTGSKSQVQARPGVLFNGRAWMVGW